jgi:photosystem II stability/assembly factor-like uncharacterized protein
MKSCIDFVTCLALLSTVFALSATPAPAASTWEWSYPRPTGAHVCAIDFPTPETGWIATVYTTYCGELYRTTDGGSSWTKLMEYGTPLLRSLSFISPAEGWACGDDGRIIHTTNGGATWSTQTSGTTNDLVSIEFIDEDYGTAVGNSGTILRTNNGGATWTAQGSDTHAISDVSFVDPANGWASIGSGVAYVLHTSTAGAFWDQQSTSYSGIFTAVDFVDANTGWMARHGVPSIIKTTNGGLNWLPALTLPVDYIHSLEMYDQFRGVACGDAYIESTVDGANWTIDSTGLSGFQCTSVPSADAAYCAGDNGLILKSSDLLDWYPISRFTQGDFRAVCTPDNPYRVWACGENGIILHSDDAGTTWQLQDQPLADVDFLFDIRFLDDQTGFACGRVGTSSGCVLKTTDGGETWQDVTPAGSIASLNSIDFQDSQNGAAVGDGGEIIATHDGGQTWSEVTGVTTELLYRVRFAGDMTGFAVGNNGKMLHFDLATDSWSSQFSSTNFWLRGLYCLNPDTAWAVGWNGQVIRTYNAGANWYTIAMTSHNSYDVWFADANNGYLSPGLYCTSNGGVTWTEVTGTRDGTVLYMDFIDLNNGWGASSYGVLKYGDVAGGVGDDPGSPPGISPMMSVAPNPFSGSTSISFFVPGDESAVDVEIYDMAGRSVMKLIDSVLPGGQHSIGVETGLLPAGVYVVRVDCAGGSSSRTCVRLP